MQFIKVNSVALHYKHISDGSGRQTLVFINSLGTDFRIWDQVVAQMSDAYDILLYDKRGHGVSDFGGGIDMQDHIQDLIALLDKLGLSQVVPVGLSVGGLIAQGLYGARPDLCAGLVLSDTAHKIGTAEMWNDRIALLDQGGLAPMADAILERWFSGAYHRDWPAALAGYRNMLTRTPQAGYRETSVAIRDTDFTEQAGRIAIPTLCLVGSEDGATPPDLVRELAGLIPGAAFHVINGAGHLPCIEKPDQVVALLRDFLSSL